MIKQLIYEIQRCTLSIFINVIPLGCMLRARYNSLRLIIFTESIKINKSSQANEKSYSAANSIGRKFLYNSRGLDVISLLVKILRALGLAHINKVIKLLKFKSEVNLQFLMGGAIERAPPNGTSQQKALSRLRLPLETLQDLNLKALKLC